ncbi:hypothetical protein SKAU_G00292260 [Synaphobranchus kaupii]|uniref:Hydroxyacylglutathione hydrolase C-terminal domain-containing protein n=1 Tax=Synaphobranchus kaupii TaxID=118154 RepID=A0A9Q1EU11_SYNKA|nr:hypothetical protein SKAU_G00292260 [Synaphobranchus kaupii]
MHRSSSLGRSMCGACPLPATPLGTCATLFGRMTAPTLQQCSQETRCSWRAAGGFFEGTAEQMHHNLTEVLGSLPQDTKVFCGHEYTIKNLKFALKVEPENERVKEMLSWARGRDDDDKPTVPSTLVEEFDYNPFLRLSEKSVQRFTGKTDPVEVLRVLRREKDSFSKPKERPPPPHAMLALEWGLLGP